jgi:hypothetical protein
LYRIRRTPRQRVISYPHYGYDYQVSIRRSVHPLLAT